MELQDLQPLLEKPDELKKAVEAEKKPLVKPDDLKQYDPKCHAINDPAKRPDKIVTTDQGSSDVKVARLPIPLQKRIVRLAAAFLCGNPIELVATATDTQEGDLLSVIKKTWKDNKLDYKSKQLAKMMMSETECAELWYTEKAEEKFWADTPNDKTNVRFKLRMKIIAPSLGDSLFPIFNSSGDMIAFGRGYKLREGGKDKEHFDVYTADRMYYFSKTDTGWKEYKNEENPIKKIPVIYYSQPYPEWYDVQEMIDRLEKLISNHADTNDYHGSPTVKVRGNVKGFAKKGESGKIIELEGENADANYMEWNHATDSIKLEAETLMNLIHSLTDTPNISFEQMKGLGTFSGIALKMLFLGAHLKAADHEENFGQSVQRRINYIKAAMAIINIDFENVSLDVAPKFTYFLPKNELEMIEMLTAAVTGGIMSKQTAIEKNPLVDDAEEERKRKDEERNSPDALDDLNNLNVA